MKTIVHLINPLVVTDPASDLGVAQPVTFASMADARMFAAATGYANVHLCAAAYPEDRAAIPADFHALPDLTRSVLDVASFGKPRKLPLIGDLVARAVEAADRLEAEWIVYTNVDIAPMPDFYTAIAALIDHGHDAFTINRRTIGADWPKGVLDLPLMRAQPGAPHIGRDCFVFNREAGRKFDCGQACLGAAQVGKVLLANLLCHSRRFQEYSGLHLTFHLGDDRRWLAPALQDYADLNLRELTGVLQRLIAAGGTSKHPLWADTVQRFAG